MPMEAIGENPNPAPVKEPKYSTIDGPRYAVALQKVEDKCCYKDFFETEKLGEAKEAAEKEASKTGRAVIIWDRKDHEICHRIEAVKTEEKVTAPEPKKGRGRRKK